jgi:hypoxanthine phosphoribosyltransferase
MGVADGFAMDRLAAPVHARRGPKKAVREIGWAAFGEVARGFAAAIAQRFRPDVVVGVAKGGVFVGGALAASLGAEFYPVRIEKRRRDASPLPEAIVELPNLSRKKALVVDDVAASGATLAKARALARKAGAREVRTAALVVRPRGGARPDFSVLETDELVLFGWDYQLDGSGGSGGPVDPGEVGV